MNEAYNKEEKANHLKEGVKVKIIDLHCDALWKIWEKRGQLSFKDSPALDANLERLEKGTFGICDACGEEISEKRLRARPVTTSCIDCKKKQENNEKLKGL